MSYIRIETKSQGRLPSIPSLEDTPAAPIEVTAWKCRRQFVGTIIVCLGVFGVGTVFGWAAVSIPGLKSEGQIHPKNPEMEAAVASMFIFGALFAGPVAGYVMLKLGRKIATFYFSVLFAIGWMLITSAVLVDSQDVSEALILIGRFVTGFAGAACLIIGPVYVREISDDGVRTTLSSFVPLILVLGNTFCFAVGLYIKWWILSILCLLVPGLCSILIWFVPNTPRHLISAGKEAEAKKAVDWLTHGFTPEERERIFKKIKRGVEFLQENNNRAMKRSERRKVEKRRGLRLSSKPVLKPLLVSVFLVFFQQAAGINVVGSYTVEILERGHTFMSADAGTVLVGICYLVFVGVAILVVERWGRRPLLLGGSAVQFATLVSLGVFFHYDDLGQTDPKMKKNMQTNFAWIPVVCCNTFIGAYALGLGSTTWIVASDINHPDFGEISGTLDSLTYWLTAFISTATLPSLRDAIHYEWCFWLYGIICFCAFWYVFFFIYETKGKTTEEIMAHYKGTLYNPEVDDEEFDTESLGSIRKKGKNNRNSRTRSMSGDHDRRFSGGSDWSTDLETLYETRSSDVDLTK